jgi:2'-5' RNA ligase
VRLFVAIVPPPGPLAELAAAVLPLRAGAPSLRWTERDAWHLTLAFLGEVGEPVLPELTSRLARAAGRYHALELAVGGAGAFPAPGRARVLWAGIKADRRALSALAASLAAGARRAGAPPPDEGRAYRPHLTLARSREPADVSALSTALAGFAGRAWTATEVCLIRSHLGGGAPRYEQLGCWALRAGPDRQSERPARKTEKPGAPEGHAGLPGWVMPDQPP